MRGLSRLKKKMLIFFSKHSLKTDQHACWSSSVNSQQLPKCSHPYLHRNDHRHFRRLLNLSNGQHWRTEQTQFLSRLLVPLRASSLQTPLFSFSCSSASNRRNHRAPPRWIRPHPVPPDLLQFWSETLQRYSLSHSLCSLCSLHFRFWNLLCFPEKPRLHQSFFFYIWIQLNFLRQGLPVVVFCLVLGNPCVLLLT